MFETFKGEMHFFYFQFPLLGSIIGLSRRLQTMVQGLSIPFVGFLSSQYVQNAITYSSFNSLCWVLRSRIRKRVEKAIDFQFPLLGSEIASIEEKLKQFKTFNSLCWVHVVTLTDQEYWFKAFQFPLLGSAFTCFSP